MALAQKERARNRDGHGPGIRADVNELSPGNLWSSGLWFCGKEIMPCPALNRFLALFLDLTSDLMQTNRKEQQRPSTPRAMFRPVDSPATRKETLGDLLRARRSQKPFFPAMANAAT